MPKTMTSVLENHLHARVRGAIEGLPDKGAADVYALSFWVYADEDDPRRQVLDFSYNNAARLKASLKKTSSAAEAKWNFAFWLQNQIEVVGGDDDPAAVELRDEWLEAAGLNYTDENEESDFDRTLELDTKIENEFRRMCARVSRRLHEDGTIASKFGRPIPIIIHNLEYDKQVVKITQRANPDGLTDEFATWVGSL
jgi:hypothetical protein